LLAGLRFIYYFPDKRDSGRGTALFFSAKCRVSVDVTSLSGATPRRLYKTFRGSGVGAGAVRLPSTATSAGAPTRPTSTTTATTTAAAWTQNATWCAKETRWAQTLPWHQSLVPA